MALRSLAVLLAICLLGCGHKVEALPSLDVQFDHLLKIKPGILVINGGNPASGALQCTLDHRRIYGAKACLVAAAMPGAAEVATYQIYTASSPQGDCIKAVEDSAGRRMPVGTTCAKRPSAFD